MEVCVGGGDGQKLVEKMLVVKIILTNSGLD